MRYSYLYRVNVTKLHKITSVSMALFVLVSTLSIAIDKHFCAGELVDVAIFSETKTCCSHKAPKGDKEKKSCCKDEIEIVAGNDKLTTKSFDDFNVLEKQALVAFTVSYFIRFESLPKQIIPHRNYSPPLLIRDINVLDETYRI